MDSFAYKVQSQKVKCDRFKLMWKSLSFSFTRSPITRTHLSWTWWRLYLSLS